MATSESITENTPIPSIDVESLGEDMVVTTDDHKFMLEDLGGIMSRLHKNQGSQQEHVTLPFRRRSPGDPHRNLKIPDKTNYKPFPEEEKSKMRQLAALQKQVTKGKISDKNYLHQVKSICS